MSTDYRREAPELIRDFLQYHETIRNHSVRTVDAYYIDLRLFFRYLKWDHELVPKDTAFEDIPIDDIDLSFIRAIKKADILAAEGYIVAESAKGVDFTAAEGFKIFKERKCGPAVMNFLNLEEEKC